MKKGVHFLFLLFFLCFLLGQLSSQDILYTNDGNLINVTIIEIKDGIVIYRVPGDISDQTVYLSSSMLDSLRYSDGRSMFFTRIEESPQLIKRNYIGFDLFETILGYKEEKDAGYNGRLNRLHLSYERLSRTGETSFSAEILLNDKNVSDPYGGWPIWYGNWFFLTHGINFNYLPFNSFVKAGINYYPFNFSLVEKNAARIFCGISLLAGDVNKYVILTDWSSYNYKDNVFILCLISNIDVRLYLSRYVQIKAGVDLSLIPFLVFIGPEFGLNISF